MCPPEAPRQDAIDELRRSRSFVLDPDMPARPDEPRLRNPINKLVCCCARCRAYNRSRFADVPANDQRGASPQSARFVRLAAAVEEGRQAPNLVFNCSHDDDKISEVGPPQHTEDAPMLSRSIAMSVAALAAGFTQSAGALTIKECSAKYQAAKAAGTLKGQNWNDFRKTQCGGRRCSRPGLDNACGTPRRIARCANGSW
jgi:hypothetical protein